MVATVTFEVEGDTYRFELQSHKRGAGTHTRTQYKLVLSEYGRVRSGMFSDIKQQACLETKQEIINTMKKMMDEYLPEDSAQATDQQALLNQCFEQFAADHESVEKLSDE